MTHGVMFRGQAPSTRSHDESVGGFEVEGGDLVVAGRQSPLLEGAGGDGAEQALEFRLHRGGTAVEAWPFIFERTASIDEEHVQADEVRVDAN